MRQVKDIEQVLSAIGAVLMARGISFLAYAINLVEEPEAELPIQVYLHDPEGQQFLATLERDQVAARIIFESWKTKKTLYRPDLARENIYGEHLQPQPQHVPVRCALDIPFFYGTLALASAQAHAFSEEEISFLQEMTQVLEEGFLRLEDLRALQQALRREEAMGRVRSRIIAMRHLDELGGELENAWVEELRGLGIPINRASLQRPAAEEGHFISRGANFMTDAALETVTFARCPWVKEAWESGKPVVVDRARLDQAGFGPEVQSLLEAPLPGEGSLGVNSLRRNAFGPEAVRTVQLFAGLIAEGLQRLRDFEALARAEQNLKLDVALQRVRNQILQMEREEDWEQMVRVLDGELRQLVDFYQCGVNLVDLQQGSARYYVMSEAGVYQEVEGRIHPVFREVMAAGKSLYRPRRSDPLFSPTILREVNSVVDAPFVGGTVAINSTREYAFSSRDIQLLERFAQVMSEAHRRLEDLKTLEAERTQRQEVLQLDLALQRVRNEILLMQSEADWKKVVRVFDEELRRLIRFDDCGINVIDRVKGRFTAYEMTPSGDFVQKEEPLPPSLKQTMDTGIAVYRRNRAEIEQLGDITKPEVNSIVDVPIEGGTFAINSTKEEAFSARDLQILEQFARVLPEGNRRLADLKMLALREEQLHQAQKVEAIGQLATGVAHELNNPLTSVVGYSELLLHRELAPEVRQYVETIRQEGWRAHGIAERLLRFARRQQADRQWIPLNPLVREVLDLVQQQFELDHVQLTPVLAADLPPVQAHPGQLQQLLLALLQNSREAIQKTGKAGEIEVLTRQQGAWVRLEVADDGPGIPEKIRERIFEPFFTTKEVGAATGSGMGLSLCYTVAREHGGRLWAEARAVGACLVLELPARTDAAESLPTEEEQ